METQTNTHSPLQTAIDDYSARVGLKFNPTRDFYENVGINRLRFWQLVKGKKEPLASEAVRLSEFFSVPLATLCAK
jgi:hypothetical protein